MVLQTKTHLYQSYIHNLPYITYDKGVFSSTKPSYILLYNSDKIIYEYSYINIEFNYPNYNTVTFKNRANDDISGFTTKELADKMIKFQSRPYRFQIFRIFSIYYFSMIQFICTFIIYIIIFLFYVFIPLTFILIKICTLKIKFNPLSINQSIHKFSISFYYLLYLSYD